MCQPNQLIQIHVSNPFHHLVQQCNHRPRFEPVALTFSRSSTNLSLLSSSLVHRFCSLGAMHLLRFSAYLCCIISSKIFGTICHEIPNLSFSQPPCSFSPPSDSLSQKCSTSSCISQLTRNDIVGKNF